MIDYYMNLRAKVTTGLVVVLVISVLLNYLVFFLFPARTFKRVENDQAINNLHRSRAIVENDISYLMGLTKDWSHWDDMYQYAMDQNESFKKSNLGIESFVNNQVSICCIYNAQGTLIWGGAFDLATQNKLPAADWVLNKLDPSHPLAKLEGDAVVSGILRTPGGLLLVVSSAILTSTIEGPSHGILIMGRIISEDTAAAWSERLNLSIRIWPLSDASLPAELKAELEAIPDHARYIVRAKDEQILYGYQVLNDLFNQPAMLMQVEMPRDIHAASKLMQDTSLISMALIGLVILLACLLLINRLVVAPLGRLTGDVLQARASGALKSTMLLNRTDELGQLSHAFEVTLGEWHAATQKAEALSQAKSDFLATVAHELRTPLSGIIGLAETILQTHSSPAVQHRLNTILSEAEALATSINELLDSAKIEAGRLKLEDVPFSLSSVLNDVVSLISTRAAQKNLEVRLETASSVPPLFSGDPYRLRQILLNLAYNAVKFTSKGHVNIAVAVQQESETNVVLRFTVEDTGIGIPKDFQQIIFQKYAQAGADTARKYGGTGLGASIARDLVTLMGGQIGLQSEAGRGSTFWFEVPFKKYNGPLSSTSATLDNEQPYISAHKARILLVEDYTAVQYAVIQHLTSVGHIVDTANHGQEALEKIQAQSYDLVLMDIQMPVMDGLEATRRLRQLEKKTSTIPIIGMTARASEEIRRQCSEAGMNDVIEKPIRRRRLLAMIDQCLTGTSSDDLRPHTTTIITEEEPAIDWPRVMREFEGNQELVIKLMAIFFENAREQITAIQYAMKTGNTKVLSFEAHKMKSGAGSLMMSPLSRAAASLEEAACSQPASAWSIAATRVVYEFERVCAEATPPKDKPMESHGV
jgi:signal transduction histidine kinase/DNA-binding response OmpR family regulator